MKQRFPTRRQFIKTILGGAASVLGTSLGVPSVYSGERKETLRVGYLPITDAAPLLVAHAMGHFQDEGLKVERPVMVRNWSALLEGFLTGKFNVTHMLLPIPIWMRFNNKVPVKVLAWDHINGSAMTVSADSPIAGFADLGGKQVAVPFWYSMHNVILQMALRRVGLQPVIQDQSKPLSPSQVNLFILPPPDMPAALLGKKIDGYIVAEPFNAIGEIKIGARIMRFTGDIWKNHPCCVVVMNEAVLRSRPVFTQKVVNAIVRAQLWISNNLAETANILGREGMKYLPVSKKVMLRALTGYSLSAYGEGAIPQAIVHPEWHTGRIGFQPYPYPSATRLIIKEMRHTLMEGNTAFLRDLDPGAAAEELVDDTFVKKAMHSMGGPDRFPSMNLKSPWEREEIIEV
jgi:NitT/TauT family transport system substrate-binding protein